MKKLFIVVLAIALTLFAPGTLAEESRQAISCPEQGYSLLCDAGLAYDYTPDGGLTIYLDDMEDPDSINVFMTDAPGADFDAENYLGNVYVSRLRDLYGERLIDEGETVTYTLAGRDMPGRMYLYERENGWCYAVVCLFDLQDDYFVRYEIDCYSSGGSIDYAMKKLDAIADSFRPDPNFY